MSDELKVWEREYDICAPTVFRAGHGRETGDGRRETAKAHSVALAQ